MNTIKGMAETARSSPSRCVLTLGPIAAGVFGLCEVVHSRTKYDDLALLILAAAVVLIVYLQPDCVVRCLERDGVIFRIRCRESVAALTIDDVPLLNSTTSLEEILDVLKKHEVRATFMVMSGFMLPPDEGGMEEQDRERCLALLRRAVAEGHELANHLMFDKPGFVMSPVDFDAAFEHCDQLIASLQGGQEAWAARPWRWYRPPSGVWSQMMIDEAKSKGYTIAIGNCFPHDVAAFTRCLNKPYLTCLARPGSVIIVHDRWHTPATLDAALPALLGRGLNLGTLSEVQAIAGAEDPAGRPARVPIIKAEQEGSQLMDDPACAGNTVLAMRRTPATLDVALPVLLGRGLNLGTPSEVQAVACAEDPTGRPVRKPILKADHEGSNFMDFPAGACKGPSSSSVCCMV